MFVGELFVLAVKLGVLENLGASPKGKVAQPGLTKAVFIFRFQWQLPTHSLGNPGSSPPRYES